MVLEIVGEAPGTMVMEEVIFLIITTVTECPMAAMDQTIMETI